MKEKQHKGKNKFRYNLQPYKATNMVSFRLFAGTDVGLRENNEDNFAVCPDPLKNEWIVPADFQQVIQLGSRGCVMVVADGMGGQNAGEVASAIAIATVQKMFSSDRISSEVFDKSDTIKSYLKMVISECDIRIKQRTEEDSSTVGMGSTIILSWLIGCKLYIAWLGDSRAYSFINNKGIARLSKDHSYVQQLVDAGVITEEKAFDHPNSNVITRSLGDASQKAKPDVSEYSIEDGQIILLCSDGLCGVCRDEEIGDIIEKEQANLQICKEKLTTAALAAGGSDNITIALMQIIVDKTYSDISVLEKTMSSRFNLATIITSIFGISLLIALLFAGVSLFTPKSNPIQRLQIWLDRDTLANNEKTGYHVTVLGDSFPILEYDKSLLEVNLIDSTIMPKVSFWSDTAVCIRAICRQNPSLVDSVRLVIKKKCTPIGISENKDERRKEEPPSPTVGGVSSTSVIVKNDSSSKSNVTRNKAYKDFKVTEITIKTKNQ